MLLFCKLGHKFLAVLKVKVTCKHQSVHLLKITLSKIISFKYKNFSKCPHPSMQFQDKENLQ